MALFFAIKTIHIFTFHGLSMATRKSEIDKRTIFLVDDDEAVLDALNLSLALDGYEVETFISGSDFLRAYDGRYPGCLVIDLHMPDMSALDVRRELLKRNIDLPTIFISGYVMPQEDLAVIKAGAINFMEKPFRRSELLENINTALKQNPPFLIGVNPNRFGK
jgi:two-component system response regulator FixJ